MPRIRFTIGASEVPTTTLTSQQLDEGIHAVKTEYDLTQMNVTVDLDEVNGQSSPDQIVTFLDGLAKAIVSFLSDGSDIESPFALIKEEPSIFGLPQNPDDAAVTQVVRDYMNRDTAVMTLVSRGQTPEQGESVAENWIFRLTLGDLSDHIFWAIVDRQAVRPTYNYGFN